MVVVAMADWGFVAAHTGIATAAIVIGFAAMGLALAHLHVAAFDVIHDLRLAITRHMARLPLGYFADRASGDAKNRLSTSRKSLNSSSPTACPKGSALATWLVVVMGGAAAQTGLAVPVAAQTPHEIGSGSFEVEIAGLGHSEIPFAYPPPPPLQPVHRERVAIAAIRIVTDAGMRMARRVNYSGLTFMLHYIIEESVWVGGV